MREDEWKRFISTLIMIVCTAVLCRGAAEWGSVTFLPDEGRESVPECGEHASVGSMGDMGTEGMETENLGIEDMGIKDMGAAEDEPAPQWLQFMGQWAMDGEGYIMQFTEGGAEYTVTMEKMEEDNGEGETAFAVTLWRGDEAIQWFSCLLAKDDVKKWWFDDLNFDGFADLLVSRAQRKEDADYCHLYLWDKENGEFNTYCEDIPSEYVRYEEEKIVTAKSGSGGFVRKWMYGVEEEGGLSLLRQWDINYWDRSQWIQESVGSVGEKTLYKGSMETVSEKEGEEIFWSGILDNGQQKKTYWTLEVGAGDYGVSLRDLIPEQSLQLVLDGEKGETILRVYRKENDYDSPSDYSAVPFENLLGHSGFYMEVKYPAVFYSRYYYAVENGKLVCLADSFRPAAFEEQCMDYMVDIDGDGDRELICTVMYGGDGAVGVDVYHYDGTGVMAGTGSALMDAQDWHNWGTNSEYEEYLPDKNVIRIHYAREENGWGYKDYAIDFEKLRMSRYEAKY